MASPARALVIAVLLAAAPSLADERFDHRGAVGLLVSGGFLEKNSIVFDSQFADSGSRYVGEIGGSYAVGYNGNELVLLAALDVGTYGSVTNDWGVVGGYRGYFGRDRLKTFFDLQAAAHFTPSFTLGPRFGIGIQYELGQLVGIFSALQGELTLGPRELRLSAQLVLGLQLRSYWLE